MFPKGLQKLQSPSQVHKYCEDRAAETRARLDAMREADREEISAATLEMMDRSMDNFQKGIVSDSVDLTRHREE